MNQAPPATGPDGAASVDAAPNPPSPRWWTGTGWRDPYWIVGGLLMVALVLVTVRHPWGFDFGVHAGTIERLKVDLLHPGNPMVDDPGSTIYYSPYTWVLGVIATVTGLSGRGLLGVLAPLMMGLFVVGLRLFVRTLTPHRWAPLAALACVLLLWGQHPVVWSGFPSLFSLLLTAPYPSFAALTGTLFWWVWLTRRLDRPGHGWALALSAASLGLAAAVITLTHPFTVLTAAFGAAGIIAYRARRLTRAAWTTLGGAAAVAVVAGLAWPYYSLLTLAGSRDFDDIHHVLYSNALVMFDFALIALPALALRARRCWYDPLVMLFVLGLAVIVVGGLTSQYALARAFPGVLLAGQIALGVELADRSGAWRRWYRVAAVGLIVVAFGFQSGNLAYLLPQGTVPAPVTAQLQTLPAGPDFRWLTGRFRVGEVILTEPATWNMALPGYGLRTVAAAWPDPFLPDATGRAQDAQRLLDPATPPAERADLLRRRHVDLILLPSPPATGGPADWGIPGIALVATGPRGQLLYRVTRA